jgi:hypothetical protein
MNFRITGLSAEPFQALFGLPDAELAMRGVRRLRVDAAPGYPDRISLSDAPVGDTVLLLNHLHQPVDGPYRASHAIFVREGAAPAFDAVNTVPDSLRRRLLSLRAFSAAHEIVDADVVDGAEVEALIERLLAQPEVAYIQAHYARRGCYAARIERA